MKTFVCQCGATLFFENTACLSCRREVGFCPDCREISPLVPDRGAFRCGHHDCGARLVKCMNYAMHDVCNRCVSLSDQPNGITSRPKPIESTDAGGAQFPCDCCMFNDTIPDLTVPGNRQRWYRLEKAKRRLFYTLDLLHLPIGGDAASPRLSFSFLGDALPENAWQPDASGQRVYTGYANGHITINIREADSVEREKARVELNEPQRTLVGHFRHEIGHYCWDALIAGRREDECARVFGDHRTVSYQDARAAYYQQGPPPDWARRFISAYAAMHPSEDFAETFGTYLDMVSLLDTASHVLGGCFQGVGGDFDAMRSQYEDLGVAMNELNRDMGMLDLVPQVLAAPVVEKLRFVHDLCQQAAA